MNTTEKTGKVVSHGDHLTEEEKKKEGAQYTYNWENVTNPAHLSARNKQAEKSQVTEKAEAQKTGKEPAKLITEKEAKNGG